MEISNLSGIELRVMIIRIFNSLKKSYRNYEKQPVGNEEWQQKQKYTGRNKQKIRLKVPSCHDK